MSRCVALSVRASNNHRIMRPGTPTCKLHETAENVCRSAPTRERRGCASHSRRPGPGSVGGQANPKMAAVEVSQPVAAKFAKNFIFTILGTCHSQKLMIMRNVLKEFQAFMMILKKQKNQ